MAQTQETPLTARQAQAAALLANFSRREVSKSLGISERTLCRWRKKSAFQAFLRMVTAKATELALAQAARQALRRSKWTGASNPATTATTPTTAA